MRLTMTERKAVTKAVCERYRKAGKKAKGRMLDEFVETTGHNRVYAARILRNHGRRVEVAPSRFVEGDVRLRPERLRKRTYTKEVVDVLKKLWVMLDYITAKRLKPALPGLIERLDACKELRLKKDVRAKLVAISPASIDRLLKDARAAHTLKGRHHTKPGTLLKQQIPVRTFSDWDDLRPGFLEIDLVGHEGGVLKGDFCCTLDMTDVASGWTEQVAVMNKAQMHVFIGIKSVRARLPFEVLGIDSDNGGEFINGQLRRYCDEEKITFTRSRPYRKNDNCYVEQKNWSIVRRFAGYARYESAAACAALNELYELLRDYNNFFLPSMKLKEKIRDGAKVRKTYHPAKTPYLQLLESPDLAQEAKDKLTARYNTLNPALLHRKILATQKKLRSLATRTHHHAAAERSLDEFIAFVPI